MIYIVTGASGFLGNTVLRKLAARGCRVRALVRSADKARLLEGTGCQVYYGDMTRPETLGALFSKPSGEEFTVIHCAAFVYIKNKPDPRVDAINIGGTDTVIQKCLETGAALLYVSSVHAIPEPPDDRPIVEVASFSPSSVFGLYAKSKAEAARHVLSAVKERGLRAVIVHPSGIIGPGDSGPTHMTALILAVMHRRLPAVVKGGYDFVDVRDVAEGILSAAESGRNGSCYILSNRYVSIKELADLVCRCCGLPEIKRVLPLSAAKLAAPFCEAYDSMRHKVPLFTRYSLYSLQAKSNFSHEKASRELGYTVRSLEETVSDTVAWLR